MRVYAAILAVMLGSSAVLAQGDPRANPAPVQADKPEAKSEPKAKPAAKTKPETKPEAKSETAAEAKPEPKAKGRHKDAKAKPAKDTKEKTTNGSAPASAPLKPSGLQDTYAAIPAADRVAIQNDLTWGGDYTGPIDGEFSERLVAAVKAYQTRHKNPVTGVMSAEERAALATAVEPRKRDTGWHLADDPISGARVGVPGRYAPKVTALPNGTRWSSEQGQLQIETFRIDTGATIDGVFEQQKKIPRRRVESSNLQADSFVITGMQ
jgi:peptidoglycan hydrolase-like protein with peptidoglycan-binding domain